MILRAASLALLLTLALAAGCRAAGTQPLRGQFAEASVLPEEFSVVVWNIAKAHRDGLHSDLRCIVDDERPELVLLQEVPEDLPPLASMGGYFAASWRYPWPGGGAVGVATASRAAPESVERVHTWWREFFVTSPKLSLVTTYPLADGRTLLVVNVHLMAFELWGTLRYAAEIERLGRVMSAHHGPLLLAGDFNTWKQKKLDLVRELTDSLELREIRFPPGRISGDLGSPLWNEVAGVNDGLPLDRVFYRGLHFASAGVMPHGSSDHRALRVTFRAASTAADARRGRGARMGYMRP